MRVVAAAVALFLLWYLLSGIHAPLTLFFGVASSAFAAYMAHRMEIMSHDERLDIRIKPWSLIAYFGWLLVEIAKSNWAVSRIILTPDMPIRRHFFRVPFTQRGDIAQTIFANSITLTPGTVTVEVEDGAFWVHALCHGDGDHAALADMDAHVSRTEWR